MAEPHPDRTIEVVRGRMTDKRAEQLLRFWSANGALDEAAGRRRLPEVVCVLVDDAGEIAGVNSVYAGDAPLVGRRFWIYRNFLLPAGADAAPAMMSAAFRALEEEFDPSGGGPIGLCALIADRELLRRHPEAVWPEIGMLYAGYTVDGKQVRIAYFEGALI